MTRRRRIAGAAAAAPADEHSLRLLIVTDAWAPQVNGVVRTLETLGKDLEALGHEVRYATPEGRFTRAASHLFGNSSARCSRAEASRR